jgi:hypothetical protein
MRSAALAGAGLPPDPQADADPVLAGEPPRLWPESPHDAYWKAARTNLWQAAALGLIDRVRDALGRGQAGQDELDNALWCAAHGGQRATADLLLERGADPT